MILKVMSDPNLDDCRVSIVGLLNAHSCFQFQETNDELAAKVKQHAVTCKQILS